MSLVGKGVFTFDITAFNQIMFNDFYAVASIGAKRMEQEAKMILEEKIGTTLVPQGDDGSEGVSKSSGTLSESIQGFVRAGGNGFLEVGVSASAIEMGQWEEMQGNEEMAASTRGTGEFDYAQVLEEGSGIYYEGGGPISKKMRFWTGAGNSEGEDRILNVSRSQGQPGKRYLAGAIEKIMPVIDKLFLDVGNDIRIDTFIKME